MTTVSFSDYSYLRKGHTSDDESGFAVLRIKARGHRELVTVVGTLPEVRAGEWLEAQGAWWWAR